MDEPSLSPAFSLWFLEMLSVSAKRTKILDKVSFAV
jgi:hypothetical protein